MKILELRFKNLNSLYGEWLIDFTDADYESNGIFALTGPTGAGKSTVLDAICLALYGATPRLGRITSSANDIMSRQTGECFAEVLFASQAGVFRCRWEQRRARKSPAGNLQNQEHNISAADTGKLIENKVSRVVGVVEEKTGMDFDRFTRSVLLAQGSFDTFLKSDAEQKSKLLEQITGTEIYTTISFKVHERWRKEREKQATLMAEVAGIGLLEVDEEQRTRQELQQQEVSHQTLSGQLKTTNAAIDWLTAVDKLRQEIKTVETQWISLEVKKKSFAPTGQRLDLANQAASLDGVYAELEALRAQQSKDQNEFNVATTQLPEIKDQAEQQAKKHGAAQQQALSAKQILQDARPLLQQVRSLDQQLLNQKQQVDKEQITLSKTTNSLRELQQRIETNTQVLDKINSVLTQEQNQLEQLLQGRSLRDYKQEREGLWRQQILLTKIAQLENERVLLIANHPCPLCGALEHPYAEGNTPEIDTVNKEITALVTLIDKAEELEVKVQMLLQQQSQAQQQVDLVELKGSLEQQIAEKKQHGDELRNNYEAALAQRQAIYTGQSPDQQEQQLQRAATTAEQLELQSRESFTVLQQKQLTAEAQLQALQQRVSQQNIELSDVRKKFKTALMQTGFNDEPQFIEARLSSTQRESLVAQAKALGDEEIALRSRIQDYQTRLEAEKNKQLTTQTYEQLEPHQQEQSQRQQQLQQSVAQLSYQLERNNDAKVQVQTKQMAIQAQQKELHKWQSLHALIGSSDGKKYRNFAQGLTFELMVQHANQQLEKMTNRYLLLHDSTQPLNLHVIDNYQAGEVRSTKNLSGGESFIVSLSLALGLSKMASRKVRVDSLFLDEGFGTLDEDALDTALGTLASLQQEGKLIGVISHVPALKERIATQIQVAAGQGGRSRLQGPGCYSL